MKIILFIVTLFRRIRSGFATFILKHRAVSYGKFIGAARVPHISSGAKVEIGSHCGFNGMTISGWGGGKDRKLFSLWY